MPGEDWRAAGERIEALLDAGGPADELARVITSLYGTGLHRLLDLLHDHGALTDPVLTAMAADDLIAGLLLVHGLHPDPVETRIELALAATDVHLLSISDDGVARLRTAGCGSHDAIREAVAAAAPELRDVEFVQLIPISSLFDRPRA
ncbi:hypothetical protein AB0M02_23530 [Actinoplanes sp. NPDC051861]|uniref:hypothetical protein n=1 Tax=Actinoplanes sp. NPDC051861 TaxID=3155170 RepID=UPI003441E79A